MDLRHIFIADAANVSQEGKLNAVGIYQHVFAVSFPCIVASLTVAIVMEAKPADVGTKRDVIIKFINEDGNIMHQQHVAVVANPGPIPGSNPVLNIILNFPGLRFDKPGTYEFNVEIDAHPAGAIPLYVALAPRNP